MSARRVFAAALRLYPARTRDAFGPGMMAAWHADLEAARRRGLWAVAVFWAVTVTDAARFAAAERLTAVSPRAALATDWHDAWRSLRARRRSSPCSASCRSRSASAA